MTISVHSVIGSGVPSDEGRRLAEHLLLVSDPSEWGEVMMNADEVAPGMLIGSFYFSFLHLIWERDPSLLERARNIPWVHRFMFQTMQANEWIYGFQPV